MARVLFRIAFTTSSRENPLATPCYRAQLEQILQLNADMDNFCTIFLLVLATGSPVVPISPGAIQTAQEEEWERKSKTDSYTTNVTAALGATRIALGTHPLKKPEKPSFT